MDWRHRAACRDEDPELFFPIGNTGPALQQIEEAKAVCRTCPVIDTCLKWALETGQGEPLAELLMRELRHQIAVRLERARAHGASRPGARCAPRPGARRRGAPRPVRRPRARRRQLRAHLAECR